MWEATVLLVAYLRSTLCEGLCQAGRCHFLLDLLSFQGEEVGEDVRSREDRVEEEEQGDLELTSCETWGLKLGGRWLAEERDRCEHQEIRNVQEKGALEGWKC